MSTHNIDFYGGISKLSLNYHQIHLGPVVESIFSLTTSLRHQPVKYMPTTYANTQLFFVGKM